MITPAGIQSSYKSAGGKINQMEKGRKDINSQFIRMEARIVNRLMKRCSDSPVVMK